MPHKPTIEEMKYSLNRSERQLAKWDKQIHALENRIRADERMRATLTRRARTNRLCTRAGMLESFLKEPEALTNDQVMELLRIAFRQEPVKEALQKMLLPGYSDLTAGTTEA